MCVCVSANICSCWPVCTPVSVHTDLSSIQRQTVDSQRRVKKTEEEQRAGVPQWRITPYSCSLVSAVPLWSGYEFYKDAGLRGKCSELLLCLVCAADVKTDITIPEAQVFLPPRSPGPVRPELSEAALPPEHDLHFLFVILQSFRSRLHVWPEGVV